MKAFLFAGILGLSLIDTSEKTYTNNYFKQNEFPYLDSIYNKLLIDKVDIIFYYKGLNYEFMGLNGMLFWKSSNTLLGYIWFKNRHGVQMKRIVWPSDEKFQQLATQYFQNLDQFQTFKNDKEIESIPDFSRVVRTYTRGISKEYSFSESDYNRTPIIILKTAFLCEQLIVEYD